MGKYQISLNSIKNIKILFILHEIFFSYPSTFIESEFRKFFLKFTSATSFLPYINNDKQFFLMRSTLFSPPITEHQSQLKPSEATDDIENVSAHRAQPPPPAAAAATKWKSKQNRRKKKFEDQFFIHHTHEKRFRSTKRGLHRVHQDLFNQSETKSVHMLVGNRNRRNATHELIRKRPQQSILTNRPRTSECSLHAIRVEHI